MTKSLLAVLLLLPLVAYGEQHTAVGGADLAADQLNGPESTNDLSLAFD